MTETPKPQLCGKCGAVLSGYAPDGLCAACLLESAFEEKGAAAGESPKPAPLLAFSDYELLEEIARGGMGVVYRARQISLNRTVAIKMILGGHLANAAEMKRFRAEAETAAQLQHPNIVAIHEVGEHAGQPFFAMDLIEGRNLAQLVRDEPLPSRKAAGYLKTIAEAVQYAHSCGVLHRDLKPSNILIDDSDQPHITDFGLAKRFTSGSQLSTDDPHLTQTGQVLGSPSFIPPEQAAGEKGAIGPASDVYSLGAILYHCLTGRPPFVGPDVHTVLAQVVGREVITPRLLNPTVPRDLETIALKCLEKEPSRRYDSALALAEDLARYLNHEPIHAVPPSAIYRAQKFVRRHRVGVAVAAGFALLLTVATVVSTTFGVRANRERGFALAASQRSQLVLEFFESKVLAATRPEGQEGGLGHDVTVRAAVEAAEASIGGAFAKEPLVEASIREVLGTTYHQLGEAERAVAQHQRCFDLRHQHLGPEHPDTVTALTWLAEDFRVAGKPGEAIPLLEQALRTARKIWGPTHTNTFYIMNDLGLDYGDAGRMDDSIALLEETLKLRRRYLGSNDPQTTVSINNLGFKYRQVGRDQEALPLLEQSVALARQQLTNNHPDTLTMMNNLALAATAVGEFERALAIHQEVLTNRQRVLPPDHPFTLGSMSGVATALRDLGHFQEAFELAQQTAERSREVLGTNHSYTVTFFNNLALAAEDAGHTNQALRLFDETFNQRRETLGPDHPDTLRAMSYLARARLRSGQLAEAAELLREAEKRWRATASANRLLAAAILPSLVECRVKLSRYDDAERLAREYLTLAAKGSLRPWSKAEASGLLGAALLAQERWAEAEPRLAEALSDLQTNYARVPAHIGPRLRQSLGGWLLDYSRASERSELVEEWRRWTNAVSETKQ